MTKQALRIAAGVAALGILVGLAMPVTSQAAPARRDGAAVGGDQPGPAGLWQSLVDLWDGLVSAVFAGSDDEGGGGTGVPPGGGGNNAEGDGDDDGDGSPGTDPTG